VTKIAAVRVDDPRFPANGATVLEVSDGSVKALRERYADRDGCLPPWLRVIAGDHGGVPYKPGDRVRGPSEKDEPALLARSNASLRLPR